MIEAPEAVMIARQFNDTITKKTNSCNRSCAYSP